MTAKKETDLLVINLGTFRSIMEQNIHVRCFLYELATERFSQVMWSMQQILFKGFDHRLAAFFVVEYERTGSKYIRMTHEQIAYHVSAAREVVARMVKHFASDGLVEADRGAIKLADIDGLKHLMKKAYRIPKERVTKSRPFLLCANVTQSRKSSLKRDTISM